MKKIIIATLLGLFSFYGLTAQSVKGKVVNSVSQKAVSNVTVSVVGTTISQKTTTNGTFELKNVPLGKQIVRVFLKGFETQNFPVNITATAVDLETIMLYKDFQTDEADSTISLSDDELSDDEGAADNTAGLLQSSKDVFSRAAAFNFPWFRARGYDSENAHVLMNGIKMNKVFNGRPQWSDWGGLNDVLRNQEFANGLAPAEQTFGGVLGSTSISTRASDQRKGTRISAASTNRNYSGRTMLTHNTGMSEKGWAFSLSTSYRYAQEGYHEGSSYNAWSAYVSAEKKINDKHSFNLTALYTPNRRGKSSPNTQEVYDLKGLKYNSYWGKQEGENRNSRMKEIKEPLAILSHYWKISNNTTLNTNVAYQTGSIGNSRIGYYKANNPDPTYYKKLPSYALSHPDDPNFGDYYLNLTSFQNNGQINWQKIYDDNRAFSSSDTHPGNADYYLYEDRNDDTTTTFNTNLRTELSDNITLNGRLNYSTLNSENFASMLDLLGSEFHLDIDGFAALNSDEEQYNFDNPNRKIKEGDRFNYNYNINSSNADAFAQLQFAYDKVDFFVSGNFSNTKHQKEGLYRNGTYLNNSLGKSDEQVFNDLSFKGGLTYKLTGRHLLNVNAGLLSVAPSIRGTFANSRANNFIVPNITSQKIASYDASYIYRGPGVKARLTGYMTGFKDGVETAFYYAEGILAGTDTNNEAISSDFVGEITTGVDKKNMGFEFGMEVQATPTIKLTGVASVGSFKYDNNPHLYLTSENSNETGSLEGLIDYGTTYLRGLKTGGTSQQAYSLGFEYRDPNYWWFATNANYITDNFINVSRITRTDQFYKGTDGALLVNPQTGNAVTQQDVDNILTQEEFDSAFLVNVIGGKSWKIGDKYIGVFANISNVLNRDYKTGGFEQARKANFIELQEDRSLTTPTFGSKYWYGNKASYYLNLYLRF
ncbi:MAG: carboxypeptidase-like regulatory domain-containing protein [Flavobacteriaceae bacterium]